MIEKSLETRQPNPQRHPSLDLDPSPSPRRRSLLYVLLLLSLFVALCLLRSELIDGSSGSTPEETGKTQQHSLVFSMYIGQEARQRRGD